MGDGMYDEFASLSGHVCYGLFPIGEDGFGTRRMASIWSVSGRRKIFEGKFQ